MWRFVLVCVDVCIRGSFWSYHSVWRYHQSEVLSCIKDALMPATNSAKKDVLERLSNIEPMGSTTAAFGIVEQILRSKRRTNCQTLVLVITDGADVYETAKSPMSPTQPASLLYH